MGSSALGPAVGSAVGGRTGRRAPSGGGHVAAGGEAGGVAAVLSAWRAGARLELLGPAEPSAPHAAAAAHAFGPPALGAAARTPTHIATKTRPYSKDPASVSCGVRPDARAAEQGGADGKKETAEEKVI